jgi:hypothetical protein
VKIYKSRISSSAERIGLDSSSSLLEVESSSESSVESSLDVDDELVDSLVIGEYTGDVRDFGGLAVLETFW